MRAQPQDDIATTASRAALKHEATVKADELPPMIATIMMLTSLRFLFLLHGRQGGARAF